MSRIQIGLIARASPTTCAGSWRRAIWPAGSQRCGPRRPGTSSSSSRRSRTAPPARTWSEHTEEMAKGWEFQPRRGKDEIARSPIPQRRRRLVRAASSTTWCCGWMMSATVTTGAPRHKSMESSPRLQAFVRPHERPQLSHPRQFRVRSLMAYGTVGGDRRKAWPGCPQGTPRAVHLVDEVANAIDLFNEYLLMAPAYSIPRLLAPQRRPQFPDGHRAVGDSRELSPHPGGVPYQGAAGSGVPEGQGQGDGEARRVSAAQRLNPNGGSTALGHPFGATGARGSPGRAVEELYATDRAGQPRDRLDLRRWRPGQQWRCCCWRTRHVPSRGLPDPGHPRSRGDCRSVRDSGPCFKPAGRARVWISLRPDRGDDLEAFQGVAVSFIKIAPSVT